MESIFRKVPVSERLPEIEKYVTTIDTANEQRIYKRIEMDKDVFKEGWCWTLREPDGLNSPNNNLAITHWLEEVELTEDNLNELFKKKLAENTSGDLPTKIRSQLRSGFDMGVCALAGNGA